MGYFQGEDHGNVERISHSIFVGGFEGISWEKSGLVGGFVGISWENSGSVIMISYLEFMYN